MRFKYNWNTRTNEKIQTFVIPSNVIEIQGEQYELISILNHYGSYSSGHYTSFVKRGNNCWNICDDYHSNLKPAELIEYMPLAF